MTGPEFETSRLQAWRLLPGDEGVLQAVYGDPVAVRWVGDGQPISPAECSQWIEVTQRNYASRGYGMFKLLHRQTAELVGCCGIVHPGGQAAPEVKYCLQREHWGRGFATEAVRGLIDYGHARHGLAALAATVAPANTASERVLLKCGFAEGRRIDHDNGTATQVFYLGCAAVQDQLRDHA